MAGIAQVKAVGPSYQLADRKSASQRSINLYMRQVEGLGEDKQVVLDGAPGFKERVTLPADIRGQHNAEGVWYVVAGEFLYRVTPSNGSYVSIGRLVTDTGTVSMAHGTGQLAIVDGQFLYVLDLVEGTFTRVGASGWRGSDHVDYVDGYFVFVAPDTEQFYISAIEDATSLDALDFSSADAQPDNIVRQIVFKREIFLFGKTSTEVWIDSGAADFPFARYGVTPIEVGLMSPGAVCIAADSLVFVGRTSRGWGYVYQIRGHQPVRISTQAVEEAINATGVVDGLIMWTYHVEGNEFVCISSPGMKTTWCWDASVQQWHERAEMVNGEWSPLPVTSCCFVEGEHFVACGPTLYEMNRTHESYVNSEIVYERTWPHLVLPSMEPISYRGLEVGCSTGNGRATLEVSNDGGFRFGSILLRSLGATGRYMERVRWLGLGSARDRVFRLRFYGVAPFTFHSAVVDA